jgi:uncharacterized membrane protein HdeD (DUF308 family)
MSLQVPTSTPAAPQDEAANLQDQWRQLLALGVVSVLVGVLAFGAAFIDTPASVIAFGVLLLIAGIVQVFHAVQVRNGRSFAVQLLAAALYLIIGLFVLEDPVRAAGVLTLLLAASFFVGGLFRILSSLIMKFPAWPAVLLNGAVDLVLGVLIFLGWPDTSLWVIDLFVGIDLFFNGCSSIRLALAVRPGSPMKTA